MEPLVFEPIIKRARWGGRSLGERLGKKLGPETDYAESWEIAHQSNADSVVVRGAHAGKLISQLIQEHSTEILGRESPDSVFPLLFKFLDAHDWLSLQVHPDDERAKQYGPLCMGKTEAWVIVDAKPDSQICAGFKYPVDSTTVERHLHNDSINEILHFATVKSGDCIFIPAGTVHALGPGLVLAEIQQQSDLTFRLSDWGRMGTDGKPRQLHIQESLESLDYATGPVDAVVPEVVADGPNRVEQLVDCHYFQLRRLTLSRPCSSDSPARCRVLMVVDGNASIIWNSGRITMTAGSTALIPASLDVIQIVPEPSVTILETITP